MIRIKFHHSFHQNEEEKIRREKKEDRKKFLSDNEIMINGNFKKTTDRIFIYSSHSVCVCQVSKTNILIISISIRLLCRLVPESNRCCCCFFSIIFLSQSLSLSLAFYPHNVSISVLIGFFFFSR